MTSNNYMNNTNNGLNQDGSGKKNKKNKKDTKTNKDANNVNDDNKNSIVEIPNSLKAKEIFRAADLLFNKKNCIFKHLHDSYNKFIEEDVKNYLEYSSNVFAESMNATTYYRYLFKFTNTRISGPLLDNGIEPLFPSTVRRDNMTYSLKIFADVTQLQDAIDIATGERTTKQVGEPEMNVPVAIIPLMLRSKWCNLTMHKDMDKSECDYDPGGYFIVNGSEKVVISQDRMVDNKPIITYKKDSGALYLTVQVTSRSYKPDCMIQVVSIRLKKDNTLTVKAPILNEVNVFILMKAMGLESDKEIIDYTVYDNNDTDMIDIARVTLDNCKNEKGNKIQTQQEAIDFLINKLRVYRKYTETNKDVKMMQKKMHLLNLMQNSLLPHVTGDLRKKAYYIGYMIHELLKVQLKRATPSDRDSYTNKRVDLPGDLMFELFKVQFKKMLGECKKFFDHRNKDNHEKPLSVINHINAKTVEQGLKSSLSTGNWIRRQGVAQMLQRLTYLQTITFLRRVDAPSSGQSADKLPAPRHVHPSAVGFLCCVQTPEHGHGVGLTKHFAMVTSVTIMTRYQYILMNDYIMQKVIDIAELPVLKLSDASYYKVFFNGNWVGMTDKYIELEKEMSYMKLHGDFDPKCVSIVVDHEKSEFKVYCDSGRMYRPVIRVVDNSIQLTNEHINSISLSKTDKLTKITEWDEYMLRYPDAFEYIDTELQPYILISDTVKEVERERQKMINSLDEVDKFKDVHVDNRYDSLCFKRFTHCELHPSLLLGEITTNVPFVNHNQGPRLIFNYAQSKQAMGLYATNYRDRSDISFILYHTQKPLVTTRTSRYTNTDILPAGENCVVAIATYTGANQEDSLVFNKTSVERGKFRGTYLKKYVLHVQKNQSTSQDDIFMKPDPTKTTGMKHGSYDKLNDRGFVPEETTIYYNDVIMGKVTPISDGGSTGKSYRCSSELYKMLPPAVIDRVYVNLTPQDGYETRKVVTRSERIPGTGDKYCSRHGQKGTIGLLLDGIDMPITENGIQPDIILNPNAIPSRMTTGQLIECLVGKVAALSGMDADGTAFEEYDIESIKKQLKSLGYNEAGTEKMYNGMTGKMMKREIFIGPTYYQRLKHLTADKIHSRARGPRTLLTRQPPEGRSRDGGLRLGEMERDALVAHGMAKFIKEKLLDNSDAYATYVCDKCGLFAQRFYRKIHSAETSANDTYYCPSCNNHNEISKIVIPYAFKLLIHELMSMCIAPRIRTKKNIYSM